MSVLIVCVMERTVVVARVEEEVENGVGGEVGVVARSAQVLVPKVPSAARVQEEGTKDPQTKLMWESGYEGGRGNA